MSKKTLIDSLLFIHQLPQNLIGLVILLINIKNKKHFKRGYYVCKYMTAGISLGRYIIFAGTPGGYDIAHEEGHQKQSLYLGWLYLLVIGLPSIVRNIYDRIAHRNWNVAHRIYWYYMGYPEKWADKLGKVRRW